MSAEVLRNPRLFFPTPHPSKVFVCLGMTQLIATRCWGLASNMAMGHRRVSPGHERGRRGQEVDRSFPATPCVWLHRLPLSTWRSGQPWFFLPSSSSEGFCFFMFVFIVVIINISDSCSYGFLWFILRDQVNSPS